MLTKINIGGYSTLCWEKPSEKKTNPIKPFLILLESIFKIDNSNPFSFVGEEAATTEAATTAAEG